SRRSRPWRQCLALPESVRRAGIVDEGDGSVVPAEGGSADPGVEQGEGAVADEDRVLRDIRAIEVDAAGADGRQAAADPHQVDAELGRSDCPYIARHRVEPYRAAQGAES